MNLYNIPGKMITAASNVNPAAAIDKAEVVNIYGNVVPWQQRLPAVQKWSDVVGITWKDKAGGATSQLKYIFRQAIVTPTTRGIMDEVAKRQSRGRKTSDSLKTKWPGFKFKSGDEAFLALLGTPHGSGVVFLLTTHPDEFPGKTIESVQAFITEEDGDYHQL